MPEETSDQPATDPVQKPVKPNVFVKWLRYRSKPTRLFWLLAIIVIGLGAGIAACYFCIYTWLPQLWSWGFDPISWRCIFSVLGAIYLVIGGVVPFYILNNTVQAILKLFAEDEERVFTEKLKELRKKQRSYEDKLETTDDMGLIPLVTYSRLELEQYYKIGLNQTQRSYSYSVMAMWIGFAIIIFGILLYLFPTRFTNQGLGRGDFTILTIGSGVVTEFIAALFLWIYKSSVNNLTYFYNRQIFIHNTLLAYKIAGSMKDADAAKHTIVEKILDFGLKNKGNVFDLRKEKLVAQV